MSFFSKMWGEKKRVYLDYAAATPVHTDVFAAMRPYFSERFANASAIHKEGVAMRDVVEKAREEIARTLRVRAHDVVFTSGGTESNNLALFGISEALHQDGRAYADMEIITTPIEHPSIIEALAVLQDRGVWVRYVTIDEEGRIDQNSLKEQLSENTVLVTCAYANSEIGVVQDVKKITRAVRLHNQAQGTQVKVHIDASQAPLWLPCQMDMLGVDLMTLDAGKCYGPKGAGVLAYRHGVSLRSIMHGGGQEHGLRAGTENTPLIVGCAHALIRAQQGLAARCERVRTLRDHMIDLLTKEIEGAVLNGSHEHRIANNINISIPGIDGEFAVVTLDTHGVAASTKSACSGAGGGGSVVIREMTGDEARAISTIRFTLGEETTKKDIELAVKVLKAHVHKMGAFGRVIE